MILDEKGNMYVLEDIKNYKKEIERLSKEVDMWNRKYNEQFDIIEEMEKFFKYAYDNEVKALNDRKISVWTICLDKLKELKEGKNE